MSKMIATNLESLVYYYGNVSRETAEYILWEKGCVDGMFLLRDSSCDIVLSLCYNKSVLHYRIIRLPNGEVMLHGSDTQKFAAIDLLIENVEGLATKPLIPCDKNKEWTLPPTYWGVSEHQIRMTILRLIREWGAQELPAFTIESPEINGSDESHTKLILTEVTKVLLNKTLHDIQPWFHGKLSRIEAEKRLEEHGFKDGKFLIRERDDSSYALCLSHEGSVKHYRIDILPSGELAIQDGSKFPSLMALVSHYTVFVDGLWTSLGDPCPTPKHVCHSQVLEHMTAQHSRRHLNNNQSPALERNRNLINKRTSNHTENSLQFRSLNVEITRNAHQHYNYSRGFNRGLINRGVYPLQHQQQSYESNHYHVTDLFPIKNKTANNTRTNTVHATRKVSFDLSNECETDSECTAFTTSTVPRLVKSSSLEEFNLKPCSNCVLNELRRDMLRQKLLRTPPVPIPRKQRPPSRLAIDYANKEIIEMQPTNVATDNCSQSTEAANNKCDLLSFEEIAENNKAETESKSDTNDGKQDGNSFAISQKESKDKNALTLLEAVNAQQKEDNAKDGEKCSANADQVFSCDSLIDLLSETTFREHCEPSSSSSVDQCSNIQSLNARQRSRSLTEATVLMNSAIRAANNASCNEAKAIFNENGSHAAVNESNDNKRTLLCSREINISQENVKCETNDEQSNGGEESNAEEKPSTIDLLKEFDVCFNHETPESNNHDDKRRKSEPAANSSLTYGQRMKLLLSNGQDSENPIYDYDALKFDRDFLMKEAALGIASLDSQSDSKFNEMDLICLNDDPEEIWKTVALYRQKPLSLDAKFVTFRKRVGSGYFGEVFLGTIPSSSGAASIQVAVKVLKSNTVPNHKSEILKEAQTMSSLDHKHIVRLIGVCETDPLMIVMELAPLGPLNQYLIDHSNAVPINDIIALILQVALAMEYLECRQYIHRDLAARNVLLVNDRFAKISDFGMSRALGIGKEYYRARSASKWPLKWYAPECIYYFKFSTKSDVWSFGVTLWEATSYGLKPYEGMDGQDILRLFRENRRLPKPDNCPDEIYELMWKCWAFR
ncbi:tyrosine-protein kinase ZAP-70-like protein [Leptotrombidium deliense]|uniref:Tyrosine-protein kinase n=1 Tax=Leptotrombidium deliense TaxID=299467 RepID=A0A443STX3_9ACAR|nr:tyrosine-protein kinase ZAP-70-like protein [Leptotrombidium deliense]